MSTLLAGVVADARANLHQKIILNLEYTVLLSTLFWSLKGYGLAGIALGIGTGELVRTFLYMRVTHRDIGIPYLRLLAVYKPGLLNATAVGLGLLAVATLVRPLHLPAAFTLLSLMVAGALVLSVVVLRWPSAELRPMLQQALERLRGMQRMPTAAHQRLAHYKAFLERQPGVFSSLDTVDNPLAQ